MCVSTNKPKKRMLFTAKTRIPELYLPRLSRRRLILSSNIKYLGVIQDPNLNYSLNIEDLCKEMESL